MGRRGRGEMRAQDVEHQIHLFLAQRTVGVIRVALDPRPRERLVVPLFHSLTPRSLSAVIVAMRCQYAERAWGWRVTSCAIPSVAKRRWTCRARVMGRWSRDIVFSLARGPHVIMDCPLARRGLLAGGRPCARHWKEHLFARRHYRRSWHTGRARHESRGRDRLHRRGLRVAGYRRGGGGRGGARPPRDRPAPSPPHRRRGPPRLSCGGGRPLAGRRGRGG